MDEFNSSDRHPYYTVLSSNIATYFYIIEKSDLTWVFELDELLPTF